MILDLLLGVACGLEIKVEWDSANGLVLGVVEALEVRVCQSLVHRNAVSRIEFQELFHQIQGSRVGFWVKCRERDFGAFFEAFDVLQALSFEMASKSSPSGVPRT